MAVPLVGGRLTEPASSSHKRYRSFPALVATTFGMCGLAVAVPLLVVLGPAPTFFTAHGARRADVILFVASVVLVPAAAIVLMLLLVRSLAPRLLGPSMHLVVGLFSSAFTVGTLDRTVALGTLWYVLILAATGVAVGLLHRRTLEVRTFVRFTAAAPVLVVAWFLLISPVSALVLPQSDVGAARAKGTDNLVFVIFDELPLASLIDGDGKINARRFPAFAELAGTSTWYRNATTVAPWTNLATPALLSGKMPRFPATASYYAGNVFSMLEQTHRLSSYEVATRLCRSKDCDGESLVAQLYDDASILYLHTVLPQRAAARWLPPIEGRWANFRGRDDVEVEPRPQTHGEQPERFERFLEDLRPRADGRPSAWVQHFLLPHYPYWYAPNGRRYDAAPLPPGLTPTDGPGIYWGTDGPVVDVARQRFLLQTRYVDRLLGRLLDTLSERGLDEDTMLVVASDHGVSFTPGNTRGAPYSDEKATEVLPVPLFVKYPHQQQGTVDDRPVQTIDIVPTIADVLDVSLPDTWRLDGTSLRSDAARSPNLRYFDGGPKASPRAPVDVARAARPYLELFGEWEGPYDTFAWGPHRDLVGTRVDVADDRSFPSATLLTPGVLDVDAATPLVPALVRMRLDRPAPGHWFAVVVNGKVAGLGQVPEADEPAMAMIDPSLLRRGRNEVAGFFVSVAGERVFFRLEPREGSR